MVTKSRTDIFIESELNKVKIIGILKSRAMTRNELGNVLDISKMQMHNLLKGLLEQEYIKIADDHAMCSIAKRSMCSFTIGKRPFVGKDLSAIRARADANKKNREKRAAQGPRTTDNVDHVPKASREDPVVVKVDEHTTIYYNSRRSQKDFALKKEEKSRRNSGVAMGSSMIMFGNW
jgi:hypothetical protein